MFTMKNDHTFQVRWFYLVLGFLLGIIGVIISMFMVTDRRDKFHSALLGCCISLLLNLIFFRDNLEKMLAS